MKNNTLALTLDKLSLQVDRKTAVHGSLVDCIVKSFNTEYLILERHKAKEEDLLYLHSIQRQGAKKYIITELLPEEDIFTIAAKLDIDVFTEKQVSPSIFGFRNVINHKSNEIVELADKFAGLKPGARFFLILSSGWKEALIIFSIGFICALFFRETLLPLVKSVLTIK